MTERISRRKRPTQADVARLAGVSQAMVSYVFNNNSTFSVPEETRQRILEGADVYVHRGELYARALKRIG